MVRDLLLEYNNNLAKDTLRPSVVIRDLSVNIRGSRPWAVQRPSYDLDKIRQNKVARLRRGDETQTCQNIAQSKAIQCLYTSRWLRFRTVLLTDRAASQKRVCGDRRLRLSEALSQTHMTMS